MHQRTITNEHQCSKGLAQPTVIDQMTHPTSTTAPKNWYKSASVHKRTSPTRINAPKDRSKPASLHQRTGPNPHSVQQSTDPSQHQCTKWLVTSTQYIETEVSVWDTSNGEKVLRQRTVWDEQIKDHGQAWRMNAQSNLLASFELSYTKQTSRIELSAPWYYCAGQCTKGLQFHWHVLLINNNNNMFFYGALFSWDGKLLYIFSWFNAVNSDRDLHHSHPETQYRQMC